MEVRLQHCLGVAYHDGAIYIADTYNNKIKRLDLSTKECHTVAGSGQPSDLYEPGGLSVWSSVDAPRLYIADTNNHRILCALIQADGILEPSVPLSINI